MITVQMDKKITSLFVSEQGERIYNSAVSVIEENGMSDMISRGVLVGLSGGADSVMLLCFLIEYRRRSVAFDIAALHVNHSIRGEEADSDELFSKKLCEELGIEFISRRIDVPSLSKELGLGIEECARRVRYSEFEKIIESRNEISSIAVAHNSDDNMETVLLNILRGAGTRGASGIPPVRDNIFRPLLRISKADIIAALESVSIPYVIDSSNLDSDYKRNYVRNQIVPKIKKICDNPQESFSRLSSNLRSDENFIDSVADDFLSASSVIKNVDLKELHRAVLVRVLRKMADTPLSFECVEKLTELISCDNFSYSLTGGKTFICERGVCKILNNVSATEYNYRYNISAGKTSLAEYNSDIFLTNAPIDKTSLNVYKFSIQANLSSAIIVGELFLRPRIDGDTVFYGGMTRKLKKLFNDRKIPLSLRAAIPILCDEKGVVWVPGFGVRDDGAPKGKGKSLFVTLAVGRDSQSNSLRFYTGNEFRT